MALALHFLSSFCWNSDLKVIHKIHEILCFLYQIRMTFKWAFEWLEGFSFNLFFFFKELGFLEREGHDKQAPYSILNACMGTCASAFSHWVVKGESKNFWEISNRKKWVWAAVVAWELHVPWQHQELLLLPSRRLSRRSLRGKWTNHDLGEKGSPLLLEGERNIARDQQGWRGGRWN